MDYEKVDRKKKRIKVSVWCAVGMLDGMDGEIEVDIDEGFSIKVQKHLLSIEVQKWAADQISTNWRTDHKFIEE